MAKSAVSPPALSQQTYHQRIKSCRQVKPGLALLDSFLDVALHFPSPLERRSRFDIEVAYVLSSGIVHGPTKCNNKRAFNQAVGADAPTDRISTIILVEDLSYDVIEHLGINYNIPPEFFAIHLVETEAYRTGVYVPPRSPTTTWLLSYIAEAPFYSLRLHRYYHFPGGLKEAQRLRSSETNVTRGVLLNTGLPNGAVAERVTVFATKDKEARDIGIILTDRLLKKENPLGYAYPLTSNDLWEGALTPSLHLDRSFQVPIRTELLSYLLSLSPSAARSLFSPQKTIPLLVQPLMRIMACFTAMFLSDTRSSINRIMLHLHDHNFPSDPDLDVRISRRLCRNIEVHRRDLEVNMRIIRARTPPHLADKKTEADIEHLLGTMSLLLTRLENDVQFLASNLSIEQARLVNILAKIGILFVPVTTVAAVLSIPEPGSRFVVFGAVSVPVVLALSFWLFMSNKQISGGVRSAQIR